MAAGWLVAGLLPLAWIPDGSDAGTTLGLLGVSSTLGMTVSALALALLVRRAWGSAALAGAGRTLGAAVVAAAVAIAVGDTVARLIDVSVSWDPSSLASSSVLPPWGSTSSSCPSPTARGCGELRRARDAGVGGQGKEPGQ